MIKFLYSQKGLSIAEVLISIGILSIMIVAIAQSMDGVFRSQDNIERSSEYYQVIYSGFNKMYRDLNAAFLAHNTFSGQDQKYKTGFDGNESKINFSTLGHVHFVKNKAETDQVHVGYFTKRNDKGSYDLLRRETDFLQPDLDKGGQSFVMVPDVKSVQFEYFDGSKDEWKKKWNTDSVTNAGRLPQIVKIVIEAYRVSDAEERDEDDVDTFEYLVPVVLADSTINF